MSSQTEDFKKLVHFTTLAYLLTRASTGIMLLLRLKYPVEDFAKVDFTTRAYVLTRPLAGYTPDSWPNRDDRIHIVV